ncbi:MAG: hypothetical protein H7336_06170 [Bacteriovorax sp.]|nr:hypothetical protein [Bacteriovorax sp.]
MKIILLFMVLLLSLPAFARESIALPPVNFQISTGHALSKFDQAVLHPEEILKRYTPTGVKVSNKRVSQNEISFIATKTYLFISKSVLVNGILESSQVTRGCSREEVGYSLKMRFETSDNLVTDNVEALQVLICLREENQSKITGQIRSQIITGSRYSNPTGPFAVSLIKDQVSPLISAMTEAIKSMR